MNNTEAMNALENLNKGYRAKYDKLPKQSQRLIDDMLYNYTCMCPEQAKKQFAIADDYDFTNGNIIIPDDFIMDDNCSEDCSGKCRFMLKIYNDGSIKYIDKKAEYENEYSGMVITETV